MKNKKRIALIGTIGYFGVCETKNKNMDPIKKILTKLKPVALSELYKKINDNTLTDNDRLLLAQILKRLGTNAYLKAEQIVYGKDTFVDLSIKEPLDNF